MIELLLRGLKDANSWGEQGSHRKRSPGVGESSRHGGRLYARESL
jgi:hypothetical protein